jgi:hypothetical protein
MNYLSSVGATRGASLVVLTYLLGRVHLSAMSTYATWREIVETNIHLLIDLKATWSHAFKLYG